MSETKYTRGPWIYDNGMIETHKSPDGHVIASMNSLGSKVDADANLICAAPEMYAALKSIKGYICSEEHLKIAENALLKAEGENNV